MNEATQKQERLTGALEERERIKLAYPAEFADGAKRGFLRTSLYPFGFLDWPLDRRNAWYAGWNVGYCDRKRAEGCDG